MQFTKRPGKFLLSLGLLGALACISEAAPTSKPTSASKPQTSTTQPSSSGQQSAYQQLRQALKQLHAIEKTLEAADHDYGGHRVDAMRDVKAAEHQLREALEHAHHGQQHTGGTSSSKTTTKPSGTSTTKGNSAPEAQALSDQQLGTAVQELEQAISTLKESAHDYGGHREKAVEDLEKAVYQLKKALRYSKEKNQSKP